MTRKMTKCYLNVSPIFRFVLMHAENNTTSEIFDKGIKFKKERDQQTYSINIRKRYLDIVKISLTRISINGIINVLR